MNTKKVQKNQIVAFLNELISVRNLSPSQLAEDLGVSHTTVFRWLAEKDFPSLKSCKKIALYGGVPLEQVVSLENRFNRLGADIRLNWPDFREYAHKKYPDELDDDIIEMIEALIKLRQKKGARRNIKRKP